MWEDVPEGLSGLLPKQQPELAGLGGADVSQPGLERGHRGHLGHRLASALRGRLGRDAPPPLEPLARAVSFEANHRAGRCDGNDAGGP